MGSQKWYDKNNLEVLDTTLSEKRTLLDECVEMYNTISSNLCDYEWYNIAPSLPGIGKKEVQDAVCDLESKIDKKISDIISADDSQRIPLVKDLESYNQIAESYFQRVQYISDSITEDPKSLFIPPSGGGWKDYMFNYNMRMLSIDNADDEALMEVWDYFYDQYEEQCRIDGQPPTIDAFHDYMLKKNPEIFYKVIDIIVGHELGFDINNPPLDKNVEYEIINYLTDLGFKKEELPKDLQSLFNFVRTLSAHKLTSSSMAAAHTGIDSSEIFSKSKYDVQEYDGLGTISSVTLPIIACSYEQDSDTWVGKGNNFHAETVTRHYTDVYNVSSGQTKAEFLKGCFKKDGKIGYGQREIILRVSDSSLNGLGNGMLDKGESLQGIVETKNMSSYLTKNYLKIHLSNMEDDLDNTEKELNNIFGSENWSIFSSTTLSLIPCVGDVITILGVSHTFTEKEVALIKKRNSLSENINELKGLISSVKEYDNSGKNTIISVDGNPSTIDITDKTR